MRLQTRRHKLSTIGIGWGNCKPFLCQQYTELKQWLTDRKTWLSNYSPSLCLLKKWRQWGERRGGTFILHTWYSESILLKRVQRLHYTRYEKTYQTFQNDCSLFTNWSWWVMFWFTSRYISGLEQSESNLIREGHTKCTSSCLSS